VKKISSRSIVLLLAVSALATLIATGAGANSGKKAAGVQVCGLMPDTKTSVRWLLFDQPSLIKAFKAAGVSARVVNAQGDPQKQKTQADQCIANGAKVLIIAAIDSGSAAAIEKAAAAKGVKSIDYDRQVEGGNAVLYVSFNNTTVGVLQGKAVANALKAKKGAVVAELNGGQEDANAFLFKGGYDSVLNPLYKSGALTKGPDQFVPAWDNQKAGTIFEQMLVKTGNKIDAVAAANDGLAGAVIASLQKHGLKPIPVSGQDATPQGFQNIISGWQTMTVWKDTRVLAKAAAKAAVQLIKGQKLTTTGTVPNGSKKEPAFIIAPVALYKSNWTKIYTSGFLKKSEICTGSFKKYC